MYGWRTPPLSRRESNIARVEKNLKVLADTFTQPVTVGKNSAHFQLGPAPKAAGAAS
jgi:hypothetical protein